MTSAWGLSFVLTIIFQWIQLTNIVFLITTSDMYLFPSFVSVAAFKVSLVSTHQAFTCWMLTIEMLEQGVKYIPS